MSSIAPSSSPSHTLDYPIEAALELVEVGRYFHAKGWSLGTSSNYSVVLQHDPLRLLITSSGKDKGRLTEKDFVVVDQTGKPVNSGGGKSSAETMLHVAAVTAGPQPTGLGKATPSLLGSVLHTHSVWGTVLSDLYFAKGGLPIEGFEMIKGLAGVSSHETRYVVEIFDNTQDIPDLARRVSQRMADPANSLRHGYLIRGHGLYTWGKDLAEARRQIEVFEFLFEVVGRKLELSGRV